MGDGCVDVIREERSARVDSLEGALGEVDVVVDRHGGGKGLRGDLYKSVHFIKHVLEGAIEDRDIPDSRQILYFAFVEVQEVEESAVWSREAWLVSKFV